MKLKKKLLKESRLYIIIDKKVSEKKRILKIARRIKGSGADIIQFRDKGPDRGITAQDALLLHKLLSNTNTIFIINDYLDIAKILGSDGIHLGQRDASIARARSILGKDKIVGVSCHNLRQAFAAQKAGADYISIGPVFPTSIKPKYKPIGLNLIKKLKAKIKIPFFVIGGINASNINRVLSCGAKRIAVCRAVLKAKNIPSRVKYFHQLLH